jgi:hypothetical protein
MILLRFARGLRVVLFAGGAGRMQTAGTLYLRNHAYRKHAGSSLAHLRQRRNPGGFLFLERWEKV